MIDITNKEKCCGCTACKQICPKGCIEMRADSEGFIYPKVDVSLCIDCGLCEKVCPELHPNAEREPKEVYAAICRDEELRAKSTSGGAFSTIAFDILNSGGVVYGAAFDDNWNVKHVCVDNEQELQRLRGSKYVQSDINDSYKGVREHLKADRQVLFSGSPCQVAGLKRFLGKDYENLTCVDFVCHGVPSPMVWGKYLDETLSQHGLKRSEITGIDFRNKRVSWNRYSMVIKAMHNGEEQTINSLGVNNLYIRGFLKDLYIRPACFDCSCRGLRSGSDITIADYWGIEKIMPHLSDNKGVSLVMTHTDKGTELYAKLDMEKHKSDFESAKLKNGAIYKRLKIPKNREKFFKEIEKGKSLLPLLKRLTKKKLSTRIKRFIKRLLKKFVS